MADVSSLANKAYEAYSKGITGFSVEPLRQAAKEKRDYERQEIKSIYDITADLDAQAYGTVSDFVDQMFAGIDSKEYYYDSPEMVQKLSALRGKAKAIKETDAILKTATDQFTKNPDSFVYNRKDANGNIVAGGYEDFVKDLEARRNETFETPEQYTQSITGMLQNVGSRIDERQIVPKIQESIRQTSDELFKTLRAAQNESLETRKPVTVRLGNGLIQVTDTTDISSFQTQIEDAIISGYADDFGQLAALARGRGQDVGDDVTFSRKFVKDNMALTRVDRTIRNENRPTPAPADKAAASQEEIIKAKDVKQDVMDAQNSGNLAPLNKHLRGKGYEAREKNGMWEVVEFGKTKEEDARVMAVMNPNQAEEIYDALSEFGGYNRDAIDLGVAPTGQVGSETAAQREQRLATEKAATKVSKILESIAEPTKKSIAPEQTVSNLEFQKAYLNKLSGVSFEEKSGYIRYITVDGTKYDMTKDADSKKVNELLVAKESGAPAKKKLPGT